MGHPLWDRYGRPPQYKRPKLEADELKDIRDRYAKGELIASIFKDYAHKVSYTTIHDAAIGKSYYLPREAS